jgi:hypothetical protein
MDNPLYSIPNCYAGERNRKRIQAYKVLAEEFRCDVETVANIFNKGIDFAMNEVKSYAMDLREKRINYPIGHPMYKK